MKKYLFLVALSCVLSSNLFADQSNNFIKIIVSAFKKNKYDGDNIVLLNPSRRHQGIMHKLRNEDHTILKNEKIEMVSVSGTK